MDISEKEPHTQSSDSKEEEEALLTPGLNAKRNIPLTRIRNRLQLPVACVSTVLSICLLVIVARINKGIACSDNVIYSPVKELLGNRDIVFSSGFEAEREMSPYQGPSSLERNQLWRNLYDVGISVIPSTMAAKLDSPTTPNPLKNGEHLTTLAVFHGLRCLDELRKRLWMQGRPETSDESEGDDHLSLCVEHLRQTIMCNGDVTPLPQKWSNGVTPKVVPYYHIQHSCHNFEAVRDWAWDNRASNELVMKT